MIDINAMNRNNFYEIIQSQIVNNPDAVNFQDKILHGASYISLAAGRGDISKVSYLLENKANIYLLNNDKENVLYETAAGCINVSNKIIEGRLDQYIQIFKILLKYEAEQLAYFPEKCQNIVLLKDQQDSTNFTPQDIIENFHYPDKERVIEEFKKAIEEAETYYQKCLQNKANNIPLEPYHKQFLPMLTEIKSEETVAENVDIKWSDKVPSQNGLHQRRRSKSAEEISKERENSMKLRSRSGEIENFDEQKPLLSSHQKPGKQESWTEKLSKWFISDTSKNEKNL